MANAWLIKSKNLSVSVRANVGHHTLESTARAFFVNQNVISMAIALIRMSAIAIPGILVKIAKLIVDAMGMVIAVVQILASVMMDTSWMTQKQAVSPTVLGEAEQFAVVGSVKTAHLVTVLEVGANVGLVTLEFTAT